MDAGADDLSTVSRPLSAFKKRNNGVKKGFLSFNDNENDAETDTTDTPRSSIPVENEDSDPGVPMRLYSVAHQPKALTKSALLKEAS